MLTTLIYTLKALLRDRNNLLWAVTFPLIMSTLFFSMFNKLDETYAFEAVPVIIVSDANYRASEPFKEMVEQLAEPGAAGDAYEGALLDPAFAADEPAALELLAEGGYFGYILLDDDGMPQYFMDSREVAGMDIDQAIRQSVVVSVLDRYIQQYELVSTAFANNPTLAYDPQWLDDALVSQNLVSRQSLTVNPPSDALRYYYAVLAFSCMMVSNFGLTAISYWKTNSSALGARRALGGSSWIRSLAPTLLAAWSLALACVLVNFAYIRYGFGVSFGGKEHLCLLLLTASTLVTTLLGALIGSLPVATGAKGGISSAVSIITSVFAGLYGPATQKIGDYVARELPALSIINPARQVYEAFLSLYYYDSLDRLGEILTVMVMMAAVFFAGCVLVMRRQRFKSL